MKCSEIDNVPGGVGGGAVTPLFRSVAMMRSLSCAVGQSTAQKVPSPRALLMSEG